MLLNSFSPSKSAKRKKNRPQKHPKAKQNRIVTEKVLRAFVILPSARSPEMLGSKMVASEPVRVVGKRMRGNAIPVKVPYTVSASPGVVVCILR